MWGGDGKLEIPRLFRNAVKRKRKPFALASASKACSILICGEMRSCLVRVHVCFNDVMMFTQHGVAMRGSVSRHSVGCVV